MFLVGVLMIIVGLEGNPGTLLACIITPDALQEA